MPTRLVSIGSIAVLLTGLLALPIGVAAETTPPLPASMAAVGDSISQAASSAGSLGADAPQNSWTTGTNTTVNSHYRRLLALGAPITGQNHNRSVSGAKVADLAGQMTTVVPLQPDYLTVQIGGNDLCTDTVAQMTSVADFTTRFRAAMTTLTAGSADTYILVTSLPDAYRLWELFRTNSWSRFIWSVGGICQSLLANPTSTQAADVQRRATVRQRNIDYNAVLAGVCAEFARCRYDGGAVFATAFAASDVSGDYFHPSVAGQAKLAAATWTAGYSWALTPPPNSAPSAAFTTSCTALACQFTDASTDVDGQIVSRAWTFGDGDTSTATNPSHTYAAGGSFTVGLTVTDDDGAVGTTTATITVSPAPTPTPMWIGALAATTSAGRNSWTATVTVSVVGNDGPVSGVAVTGSWTAGSGATTCATNAQGTCTLARAPSTRRPRP